MSEISNQDADAFREWVVAANRWAEASQELVAAATEMTRSSNALASLLAANGHGLDSSPGKMDAQELAGALNDAALEAEEATLTFRDGYLATAANLEQYRQILG